MIVKKMRILFVLTVILLTSYDLNAQIIKKEIPDRLVVLTFDDAVSTHAEFVAPLLNEYGFGGTFFVCEFPPDFEDKHKYMTWGQIAELDDQGFEIANHTQTHTHVNEMNSQEFSRELAVIEQRSDSMDILKPVSFAYPAYDTDPNALDVLERRGYQYARIGGSRAYNPRKDHPYLIPSFSTTGTDTSRVIDALKQAKDGNIVVLTIHGVPDYAHDWVTTPPGLFKYYLRYLEKNNYTAISMQELSEYINIKAARDQLEPVFSDQ